MKSALSFFKKLSTLQLALGVSVAVHAALLTVRFVHPQGLNPGFADTPPLQTLLYSTP